MKRLFLITLILVLAGCAAPDSSGETEAVEAVPGVQVGQIAPDFTVPTLDNGSFTLSEHVGKPTIIFFMAYWCGTCLPEARALTQLQQEYGDRLTIIALDVDPTSSPEALRQFQEAADGGPYIWAFDTNQQVAVTYEVQALDTTLVLDGNGRILYRDATPTPYQTLKEALAEVLP